MSTGAATQSSTVQSVLDAAWQAVQARYPDAKRPEVPQVRVISTNEWAEVTVQCLTDQGFPYAAAVSGGGIQWTDVPDVQMEGFEIAQYTCSAMYPRDPAEQNPLTESQLNHLYDYYTGEMTDCFASLGYEVSTPPSRQRFIETYGTDPWLPFVDVYATITDADEYTKVEQACPQVPDDLWK